MKFYRDTDDWWIGLYRGPNHFYVCPLPTLVIRWERKGTYRDLVLDGRRVRVYTPLREARLTYADISGNIDPITDPDTDEVLGVIAGGRRDGARTAPRAMNAREVGIRPWLRRVVRNRRA